MSLAFSTVTSIMPGSLCMSCEETSTSCMYVCEDSLAVELCDVVSAGVITVLIY